MLVLDKLSYSPRGLGPLSLTLEPGQVVLLCGPSGSGKSTLCALVTGELEPTSGQLERPEGGLGSMTADVEGQLLGSTLGQELELGRQASHGQAETAGLRAAREGLLAVFRGRDGEDPQSLSAGEQQLLLLASLSLGPFPLLLLDEGLSLLDQASFESVCRALRALAQAGRLVIVVSHELRVLPWVDRCLGLREGRLAFEVAASELTWDHLESARMWLGTLAGLARPSGARVLQVPEASSVAAPLLPALALPAASPKPLLAHGEKAYPLAEGGMLGLAGVAGSGKSRLLAGMAGLQELPGWRCLLEGYRVLLRQHAPSLLWRRTVRAELEASLAEGRRRHPGTSLALRDLVEVPESWRERSPRNLSQGQLKLVASLCLLLQRPDLLLLDQPFASLDAELRGHLERRLGDYLKEGGRAIFSTHQSDEMVLYPSSLLVLEGLLPVWSGRGAEYFQQAPDPRLGRPSCAGLAPQAPSL
jgi:energy-coupling factor transporter ATP-binding protein EcfA2